MSSRKCNCAKAMHFVQYQNVYWVRQKEQQNFKVFFQKKYIVRVSEQKYTSGGCVRTRQTTTLFLSHCVCVFLILTFSYFLQHDREYVQKFSIDHNVRIPNAIRVFTLSREKRGESERVCNVLHKCCTLHAREWKARAYVNAQAALEVIENSLRHQSIPRLFNINAINLMRHELITFFLSRLRIES